MTEQPNTPNTPNTLDQLRPDDTAVPSENPVARLRKKLADAFTIDATTLEPANSADCMKTLVRFLKITNWTQGERRIFEAMPHADKVDTVQSFRAVLYRLGFKTSIESADTTVLRNEYLPCFIQLEGGRFRLVERIDEQGYAHCFNPETDKVERCEKSDIKGVLIFPEQAEAAPPASAAKLKWSSTIFRVFRPVIGSIFAISFITNLLAMLTPLFVMNVYDKAIGAKAYDVLLGLTVGIIMVLAADFMLREIRGRLQSYLGGRLDNQINEAAFRHLLHMPLSYTQDAPLGAQITRLRQMTSVREAFTGMLANAIFDLPFILLFLAAIAMIGGGLVFAPIALILCYIVIAAWGLPHSRGLVRAAGDAKAQLNNLTVESLSLQNVIHDLNAEEMWLHRHRQLSAQSAAAGMKGRQLNMIIQTLSQSLLTIAGVLTLAIGVRMVVDGTLSSGALIAVMALSWRVLNPLRNILLSSLTFGQTMQSIEQIDRLLRMPLERDPNSNPTIARTFKGTVIFDRVSFRYPTQKEPALRGVSFAIKPGQMLCICGKSGSGKSTTLKLLASLHQQQAGSILIDGLDLRQVDPGEWRQSLGVTLEESHFLFGTVAQNLRLSHPSATIGELEDIAEQFGLTQFYNGALKDGLETKITTDALSVWPDALKKRLALSRAFIRKAPIYLLDNPADNLDDEGERALLSIIEERRKHSAIIMTTHRPSHIRLADKALWIDNGAVVDFGDPEQIVPKLLAS